MTYEQNFLKDFQEWVDQQVQISELAMKAAEKIATEDGKKEAKEAAIRYESRQTLTNFCKENLKTTKMVKISMTFQILEQKHFNE